MPEKTTSSSLFDSVHLTNLPLYAKLFVALFTALMLCVCFWAIWILYESQGKPDSTRLPAYLQPSGSDTVLTRDLPLEVQKDIREIWEDSAAVLAPRWDSQSAGRMPKLDSATIVRIAQSAMREADREDSSGQIPERGERRFRHNLALAHTHINGQTLLFFAMGFLFLFTSAKPKVKRIVLWLFGASVLSHAIGLTGRHSHWFFDDILAFSGLAILVSICYMALVIFMDLARRPGR